MSSAWMTAQSVWSGVLDLLYPPRCLICKREPAEPLCRACRGNVEPLTGPYCDRCGIPVPAGALTCDGCAEGPGPHFVWSQAIGHYTGSLRTAIHLLKYQNKGALAAPLGEMLSEALEARSPLQEQDRPFDCVVPVPLHPSRERQRGFNQAQRIARVLCERVSLPLDTGLVRVRSTRSQTSYHAAERQRNVAGVFDVRTPMHFENKSVLLIDDVLTTMSTVNECARVLSNAGARRVAVLALARGM